MRLLHRSYASAPRLNPYNLAHARTAKDDGGALPDPERLSAAISDATGEGESTLVSGNCAAGSKSLHLGSPLIRAALLTFPRALALVCVVSGKYFAFKPLRLISFLSRQSSPLEMPHENGR